MLLLQAVRPSLPQLATDKAPRLVCSRGSPLHRTVPKPNIPRVRNRTSRAVQKYRRRLTRTSLWSGRRESNPRCLLGRQKHYHYATPARNWWAGLDSNQRTALAGQIYSLLPLTTRPPTHVVGIRLGSSAAPSAPYAFPSTTTWGSPGTADQGTMRPGPSPVLASASSNPILSALSDAAHEALPWRRYNEIKHFTIWTGVLQ